MSAPPLFVLRGMPRDDGGAGRMSSAWEGAAGTCTWNGETGGGEGDPDSGARGMIPGGRAPVTTTRACSGADRVSFAAEALRGRSAAEMRPPEWLALPCSTLPLDTPSSHVAREPV
mmetsp:Transcript_10075/g.26088  ORF Transcript_10075/g.26088 Transcript_10075/m.26088 type:complete len:116 (+) Transcript_10075:314-661(+)